MPAAADRIENELARLVRRVRLRALGRLSDIHPDLDYGQFLFFLAICDSDDGVRGGDLADQLGVHKSTASRAVSALERHGLIDRTTDPDDGRAQLLVPRPEALARLEEYRTSARKRLKDALEDWTSAEVDDFAAALGRFNDRADEL